jgi:hypothetical protein
MKTSHQSIKFGIKGRAAGSKVQYVQESSRHNALAFQFIHLFISMHLLLLLHKTRQPTLKYTHLSFLPPIKKRLTMLARRRDDMLPSQTPAMLESLFLPFVFPMHTQIHHEGRLFNSKP